MADGNKCLIRPTKQVFVCLRGQIKVVVKYFCGSKHRLGFRKVSGVKQMAASSAVPTADICDKYGTDVDVTDAGLIDFGGRTTFGGEVVTIKCCENNPLVRAAVEQPGHGKVLVVDGGGSLRCALVGDIIAGLAVKNGWAGIIINGCVRDVAGIRELPIGIKALGCTPRRSGKLEEGKTQVPVTFLGATFRPGHIVCADADGVVVARSQALNIARL